MGQSLSRVSVVGTGSCLPNAPIPNREIDDVLGRLIDAPDHVRVFSEGFGPSYLESSGIRHRHFAIDPATRRITHTCADMAADAAHRALQQAGRKATDVDLLLLATPYYDHIVPPTSTALQERLGIECCVEMEIHSNCAGVGKCMQIGFDALRLRRYETALVAYVQHSSSFLRSCWFHQQRMTKSQAALRYILADGAGAVVLEAGRHGRRKAVQHELLGVHVESIGGLRPAGMTAGGGVAALLDGAGSLVGLHQAGSHHLDQDFPAVNREGHVLAAEATLRMLEALQLESSQIDHYVGSIPNRALYEQGLGTFTGLLKVDPSKVKFRAVDSGYCGGASILVYFDHMVRDGELRAGETVALGAVESSKWMWGGFVVRW
jgi:3-oxoacyl-[acyl-carrier-protein] synthase-3